MAAVHNDENPEAFRFLDLPAELRNRIYQEYFKHHDNLDSELDLFHIRLHLPSSKLTTACRHIHTESQGLYEKARTGFLRANTFFIGTDWRSHHIKSHRDATMREALQLPSALKLYDLTFRHVGREHPWIDTLRIKAKAMDDGRIGWRALLPPNTEHRVADQERYQDLMIRALQRKTEELVWRMSSTGSSMPRTEEASLGLNFPLCLELVYKCTEKIGRRPASEAVV
ncbi:hypothetical protein LTR37_013485 [Vermiconidia calcicola]|uniref:Uncharacterized protein n=1 Tax=Vermiconidia calcicola TaxID=1690605 RepID=A0ACC3MXM3_9PEZI|nr:hypothetical protein LTR37_013485 [Vermiconidia calcicola]